MTLVQFFVNFLKPYAKEPEFTICVMKALEELKRPATCPIKKVNDTTLQKDLWCDE